MSNVLKAPELYITDPQYNGKNLTNHVLMRKKSQKLTYYCPGYLRIKIKNFAGMSHDDLQATINVTLLLTINTKGIPEIVKNKMKTNIILRFNRDQALLLDSQNLQVKMQEGKNEIKYTVRKLIHSGMTSQIFLSPFEVINLIMSVTVQSLTFYLNQFLQEEGEEQKKNINDLPEEMRKFKIIEIRFNLMDLSEKQNPANKFVKISFTEEGTFGNYDLAQNKLRVQYTNENTASKIRNNTKKLVQNQIIDYSKLSEYQYAHFQIPLYKFPTVSLVTIFLPLWLLGIMNLGIFFQDNGLADRIGSLAGLMIAFVALIPVIRSELPPNPNITFVQILVYIQTLTTLLCLIESIRVRDSSDVFVWYENGLFLTSMIIDILEFVIIAVLMFIHYCYWLPSYNVHASEQTAKGFKSQEWYNQECDAHFRRKIDNGEIVPLEYERQMNRKRQENQNPLI